MKDGRFVALLRRTSANGTYHFTQRQLESEWASFKPSDGSLMFVGGFIGVGVGAVGFVFANMPALVAGIVGACMLALRAVSNYGVHDPATFRQHIRRWQEHEPIELLLTGDALRAPPPEFGQSKMLEVGVEAILVVDDPLLVDFFVLNQAHADQRVLVISSGGYPSYILPAVQQVLLKQTDVPVCYVHGSGTSAEEMRQALSASLPMHLGHHRDLGWSYADASRSARVRRADALNDESIAIDWLPPKRLLESVARAIATEVSLVEAMGFGDQDVSSDFG